MSEITYWDRRKKCLETEHVYGDQALRSIYGNSFGRFLADTLLSRPLFSRLYCRFQSSSLSRGKIAPFIQKFKVSMEEYEDRPFQSFNDFFTRLFRENARPFTSIPGEMPALAEGRYLAYEDSRAWTTYPVKGQQTPLFQLLGDENLSTTFSGPVLIARLCPTDYHRFHFPDDGVIVSQTRLKGPLHSVNPLALATKSDILFTNERQLAILETKNFGKLAYIEVGAMCVGRIVQKHSQGYVFKRGEEKGHFLFGGSTVILVGEKGRWKPDADLLEQTAQGRETFIRLGERLAQA